MISANELAHWAGTTPAQSELPRLVRRLVHAAASLTQISFPAGDSVTSPGFDGELHSHEGNAWVPAGFSVWELSCRGDVGTKANEDFDKRCAATPESVRATRTYVAVTARRWPGKAKWREAKAALNIWSDVRAYDADDIEQWLEQSPAVALAFGGELGLSGSGVEAVAGYFGRWAGQCRPVISSEALLAGRTEQAAAHLERIRAIIGGQVRDPLAVKADSVEEAVAFVAAALLGDAELEASAVVVTGAEGWRFVEANPNVRIAVAGSPAIAEAPVLRDGLAVIVPYASGDMARLFAGVASKLDDNELSLERAIHYEFEKALALIGVEGNDARRLATLCGRSWSVFRRQHAVNPAIRRPAWLDHPASAALALLCLAGAWSSAHDADVEILERIAGRSYCEIEAELLALERLDDSPVLHIGKVWKAKSALELLALFGDRIDVALLDRYFAEVEAVLAAPDPQLELPDSERYAASIKGKVRPISGMLLEALCDTLVKLAVRGPEVPALAVRDIAGRIDRLVRHLLFGADRTRWLSLASQLPALAEASPHEFLSAVEDGIAAPDGAARAVFHETSGTGFGSRCWHSGMLWALETLAWAPNRLRRVALILARLSDIQIAGNWANSPRASLQDIFRPWFPQTGATIDQRIRTLDHLMEHAPEVTFALFDHMTDTGLDHASYIARPKWRDDDAGAGHGATRNECQEMMVAAIDRQIAMAKGYPDRVRELVDKYMTLDTARRGEIMTLLSECETAGDGDREAVRSALRRKLFWHRNYDEKRPPAELDALLAPLEEAYDRLEPDDLIVRHGWLFNAGFADLPERRPRDDFEGRRKAAAEAAQAALREIFDAHGWEGVMRLAEQEGNSGVVGAALARIGMPVDDLDHWIVGHAGDLWTDQPRTRITTSLLLAEPADTRLSRIDRLLAAAADSGRDADWQARLLMLLPHNPAIWDRAEKIGRTDYYWRTCDANLWIDAPGDKLAALRQLIAHERPVSALNACYSQFENIPAALVMEMLEGILKGQEINDGVMPHSYAFQYAVDHIEADGSVDETRLAQIEFALIPCLGYTNEHHARTLYKVVMSQPGTFVELLCLIYKPRHGEQPELDESAKTNAETAWRVLRACEHVPGTQKDGSIDADELRAFVTEARRMAIGQDRAGACDTTLGQILAHAPEGQDAIWPAEAVRDIFEAEASEKMFEGLWVGCMNKRGVHSRGAYEGGDQERDLAADYRRHGNALEASHPQLAASVLSIADYYDRHGLFEDMDARLRQEGH